MLMNNPFQPLFISIKQDSANYLGHIAKVSHIPAKISQIQLILPGFG